VDWVSFGNLLFIWHSHCTRSASCMASVTSDLRLPSHQFYIVAQSPVPKYTARWHRHMSRGCHEDATRKTDPWNLSLIRVPSYRRSTWCNVALRRSTSETSKWEWSVNVSGDWLRASSGQWGVAGRPAWLVVNLQVQCQQ